MAGEGKEVHAEKKKIIVLPKSRAVIAEATRSSSHRLSRTVAPRRDGAVKSSTVKPTRLQQYPKPRRLPKLTWLLLKAGGIVKSFFFFK